MLYRSSRPNPEQPEGAADAPTAARSETAGQVPVETGAPALPGGPTRRRAALPVRSNGAVAAAGSSELLATLPLAQGELGAEDAAELSLLKRQIERHAQFHCAGYKEKCLRRRIAVRMRACAVHRYADYARLLDSDPVEYERLIDALTVNVSKFFRNPEVWDVIAERVLPQLYGLDVPVIRAWSAGSAGGEEAYTLSILAHEYAAAHDQPPDRLRVLGTDIDRQIIAAAKRGEYTDFAMTDIAAAVRDRWFDHDGTYRLRHAAREGVQFAHHDLMRDRFPRGQHLILCRNVIIYFERPVQEELFRRFHEALVPGGFLVLGKVEALFGAAAALFDPVVNRQRVFRKS
jgi:chemotaxis protein methyltransferase CheR